MFSDFRIVSSEQKKKIYLNAYATGNELYKGLKTYLKFRTPILLNSFKS